MDKDIPSFEDWLQEYFMNEEPMILDDDLPDAFDNWVCNQDPDDWINLGQMYGGKVRAILRPDLVKNDLLNTSP